MKKKLNHYANIDDEPFAKAEVIDLGYEPGLYSILFLYARQGNYILKGKLSSIKDFIKDELKITEYFYNITFWKDSICTNSHWDITHPYLQYRRLHRTRVVIKNPELILDIEKKSIKINQYGEHTPNRNVHVITLNSEAGKIIASKYPADKSISFYNHPVAFFRRMPKVWLSEFNEDVIKDKLDKLEII